VEIKVHLNENSSWNKMDSNAFNVILNYWNEILKVIRIERNVFLLSIQQVNDIIEISIELNYEKANVNLFSHIHVM